MSEPKQPEQSKTPPVVREELEQKPYQPRYRPLWNNVITHTGAFIAVMAFLGLITFGLFSVLSPRGNPYVDVVGFLIIPGILLIGLLLVPLGIYFKSWRLHRKDPAQRLRFTYPRIDLYDPAQRRVAKIFVGTTFVVLPLLAISGYQGYHYTDSVEFCGTTCHTVMSPHMMAYELSPHARVSCAECHIGPGAGWFVKSKLSGTRQVFAVLRDDYPRPIPSAITELRPARETCEQCHWPQKFFGSQLREIVHYSSDEQNTLRRVDMLLRTGGGDGSFETADGIHRHMALEGTIEYISTSEDLQEIPWVKWTTEAGQELIYRSDGKPSSDPAPEGIRRTIDCMDCHNRPAHKFTAPQQALDVAMFSGRVDPEIPYIKREAVRALLMPHQSAEEGRKTIGEHLSRFYETRYPDYYRQNQDAVYRAIDTVREIFDRSFFPEMKVNWRTYPDNIGHFYSPGCFRCHEGNHVNQNGKRISHDCNVCHTFLNPTEDRESTLLERGRFQHPYPLGPGHEKVRCSDCHSGGFGAEPSCEGCHVDQQSLYAASVDLLGDLGVDLEPNPMYDIATCTDCHDTSQHHDRATVVQTCVDCHDGDEGYAEIMDDWTVELHEARGSAVATLIELRGLLEKRPATTPDPKAWLTGSQDILSFLERAGDQHNPILAVEVYEALEDGGRKLMQTLQQDTVKGR